MRSFGLVNGDQYYDLTDLNHFADSPSGLGFDISADYYQYLNSFLTNKANISMAAIDLRITFGYLSPNPYIVFQEFVNFISLNKNGIMLQYSIPDLGTFYRDINIVSVGKSEIVSGDVIQENIKMDCISPWYKIHEIVTNTKYDDQPGDGKIYADDTTGKCYYIYGPASLEGSSYAGDCEPTLIETIVNTYNAYNAYYEVDDVSSRVYNDANKSTGYFYVENVIIKRFQPSDYEHTIGYVYEEDGYGVFKTNFVNLTNYGLSMIGDSFGIIILEIGNNSTEIVNPSWYVLNSEGQEICSDGFDMTILPNYFLVVSSDYNSQKAYILSPNGSVSNANRYQDMTKTNFVTIPYGKHSIRFKNFYNTDVKITFKELFDVI